MTVPSRREFTKYTSESQYGPTCLSWIGGHRLELRLEIMSPVSNWRRCGGEPSKDEMLDGAIGSFTEAIKPLNNCQKMLSNYLKKQLKRYYVNWYKTSIRDLEKSKCWMTSHLITRKKGSDNVEYRWENSDYELYCRTITIDKGYLSICQP